MSMLRNRGEGPLAIICMTWSPIVGGVVKGDRANAREVPPAPGNRPSVGHGWRTPWGSVKVRSQNSGGAMLQRSPTIAGPSAMRGFTLVELMVTLAVLTIIAVIATPSFANLIRGKRLTSSANEMVDLLQTARSAARAEEQQTELQSQMRISYHVFCLYTKTTLSTSIYDNAC